MPLPTHKHLEVEMYFLTTEEGGRRLPVFSGYRPQFHFDGQDWDAVHEYIGVERVAPGETVSAHLTFISAECQIGKLHSGQKFLIREGARTVARGQITRVLDPNLQKLRS